jgi:hypothetical protein
VIIETQPPYRDRCYDAHGTCEAEGAPDPATVLEYVQEGDARAIATAISSSRGALKINTVREALQLVSCDGDIALHVPLSDELQGALRSELKIAAARRIAGTMKIVLAAWFALA